MLLYYTILSSEYAFWLVGGCLKSGDRPASGSEAAEACSEAALARFCRCHSGETGTALNDFSISGRRCTSPGTSTSLLAGASSKGSGSLHGRDAEIFAVCRCAREVGTCSVQISELPSQQQPVLFASYETRNHPSMSTLLQDSLIVYEECRPNSR